MKSTGQSALARNREVDEELNIFFERNVSGGCDILRNMPFPPEIRPGVEDSLVGVDTGPSTNV